MKSSNPKGSLLRAGGRGVLGGGNSARPTNFGQNQFEYFRMHTAKVNTQTQSTEIVLQDKVRLTATGIVAEYTPEIKLIHELGNTVLIVHSYLEGVLEELIVAHLEGWMDKINVLVAVDAFIKYQPLLGTMFFIGKLNACKKYGCLYKGKKDRLTKLLRKINSIRNEFAHFQCYRYKLEKDFWTVESREKILEELDVAMDLLTKRKNQIFYKSLS